METMTLVKLSELVAQKLPEPKLEVGSEAGSGIQLTDVKKIMASYGRLLCQWAKHRERKDAIHQTISVDGAALYAVILELVSAKLGNPSLSLSEKERRGNMIIER